MSRIVVINGTEREQQIDYSTLSTKVIDKRLKSYEKQYGSFRKFFRNYDCESSSPEDYLALVDWESLLAERGERKQGKSKTSVDALKRQKVK